MFLKFFLILNFLLVEMMEPFNCIQIEQIECPLIPTATTTATNGNLPDLNQQPICKLELNLTKISLVKSNGQQQPMPFEFDSNGNLIWSNKYQPLTTRWSQLCPSPYLLKTSPQLTNRLCVNSDTCDSDGFCLVDLPQPGDDSNRRKVTLKLIDNLNEQTDSDGPIFPIEMNLLNVTIDLGNDDLSASNDVELVLIESTNKLDLLRSKPIRSLNEFRIETTATISNSPMTTTNLSELISIRFDKNDEKIYLKLTNKSSIDLRKENENKISNSFKLIGKRLTKSLSSRRQSSSLVVVNIVDNRLDKPIFDYQIYNFTIVENSPIDTLIGQVHAIYLSKHSQLDADSMVNNVDNDESNDQIKYRIVPFLSSFLNDAQPNNIQQFLSLTDLGDENGANNGLPIRIDQLTGLLIQKLNIDREKYLMFNVDEDNYGSGGGGGSSFGGSFTMPWQRPSTKSTTTTPSIKTNKQEANNENNGLLRLNIESSYETNSYSYCKVNIFIQDVNDNAPIARIRPLANFGRSFNHLTKTGGDSVKSTAGTTGATNLFVDQQTPINQIMAYLAVYDPDAGENGTIKSIDLTLLGYRYASNKTQSERQAKLNQLKQSNLLNSTILNKLIEKCLPSAGTGTSASASSTFNWSPQIPFRLNKISDKIYTIQLTTRLEFKQVESYEIEMRIQDNGTRPQLETKSIITLNVIDQNEFAPIFLNTNGGTSVSGSVNTVELSLLEESYNAKQTLFIRNLKTIKYTTTLEWPVIYKFTAIDLDDGQNGLVKYKLINNPFIGRRVNNDGLNLTKSQADKLLKETFELNAETGELKLLRKLNRDNGVDSDRLELIIMAIDSSETKPLNSTIKLRINIIDINDNQPQFETESINLELVLNEMPMVGAPPSQFKLIGSINVKDLDSYEKNSEFYVNRTSSDLNENEDDDESINKRLFLYKDKKCLESLKFRFVSTQFDADTNPFLFLIENNQLTNAKHQEPFDQIECKLNILFDTTSYLSLRPQFDIYKFQLSLADNGGLALSGLSNKKNSTLSVSVYLNKNERNESTMAISSMWFSNQTTLSTTGTDSVNDKSIIPIDLDKTIDNETSIELVEFSLRRPAMKLQIKSATKLELNDSSKTLTESLIQRGQLNSSQFKLNCLVSGVSCKLIREKRQSNDNEPETGVYLIDLELTERNLSQFKRLQFLFYTANSTNYQIDLSLLNYFNEKTDSALEKSKLRSTDLANLMIMANKMDGDSSDKVSKVLADSSFGQLIQFDSILFGAASSSSYSSFNQNQLNNNNNNQPFLSDEIASANNLNALKNLLFGKKSSLVSFIALTSCVLLFILGLFISCIYLLLKKRLNKNKKNKNYENKFDDLTFGTKSINRKSTCSNKKLKNLNVVDDEQQNNKETKRNEEDNGGFMQIIVTEDNKSDNTTVNVHNRNYENSTKETLSEMCLADETKEKVNRYLNGLEIVEQTSGMIGVGVLELTNNPSTTSNEICGVSSSTLPSSSSCASTSPSSICSITNSKKNLILTTDYNDQLKTSSIKSTTTTATNGDHQSNRQIIIISTNNPQDIQTTTTSINNHKVKSSVCGLSTSSSCMSDEGCYGSSDFSSERDSAKFRQSQHFKPLKLNAVGQCSGAEQFNSNLKQINLNQLSPIVSSEKILIQQQQQTANTQLVSISNSVSIKQQQNYYLSRFEKIYNNANSTMNKNEFDLQLQQQHQSQQQVTTNGGTVKHLVSTSGAVVLPHTDAHNNNIQQQFIQSNSNKQQVITSISGSYV